MTVESLLYVRFRLFQIFKRNNSTETELYGGSNFTITKRDIWSDKGNGVAPVLTMRLAPTDHSAFVTIIMN